MCVGAQCERHIVVTQNVGDHVGRHAFVQGEGGEGVAESLDPDVGDTSGLAVAAHPLGDRVRFRWSAIWEDECWEDEWEDEWEEECW